MMKNALLLLLLSTLLSCGKDRGPRIPEVFVDYRITVQDFENGKGEYDIMFVDGYGVAGLLIYKVGLNQYKAYDRCSSVEPEKKCAVVRHTAFTVKDPCSGALFSLGDGTPQQAPAIRNLKEYSVRVINNFNILVSNDYGN